MKAASRFLIFAGLVLTSPAAAQSSYSGLYVFGDSLVDSGNAHLATLGQEAPVEDGYYLGRFSNGPNFADYLSDALVGTPATPVLLGGTNAAVGGATSAFIPGATSPSFLEQIGLYNQIVGQPIASDALVLVTFGGNDVRGTIDVGGAIDFSAAANDLATGLGQLYAGGARNFVITGSPDIGLLPRSLEDTGGDPTRLDELSFRSEQISALFASTSASFAALTGADVTFFDLLGFEGALMANPPAFGLTADFDFTTPCQIPGAGVPQFANCSQSLYFDGIHPTTVAHGAIAGAILAQLNDGVSAVPEPSTWMMMIVGFGLLGARLRMRRRPIAGNTALQPA